MRGRAARALVREELEPQQYRGCAGASLGCMNTIRNDFLGAWLAELEGALEGLIIVFVALREDVLDAEEHLSYRSLTPFVLHTPPTVTRSQSDWPA